MDGIKGESWLIIWETYIKFKGHYNVMHFLMLEIFCAKYKNKSIQNCMRYSANKRNHGWNSGRINIIETSEMITHTSNLNQGCLFMNSPEKDNTISFANDKPKTSWSLLAKIFNFGKYVRLTVCLSVCLSVRMDLVDTIQVAPFDQSSPNLTQIWTLGPDRNLLFF